MLLCAPLSCLVDDMNYMYTSLLLAGFLMNKIGNIWLINLPYAICRTCHMYLFHRNKLLAVLVAWLGQSLLAQWPAMRVASWNNRYRVSRYLILCLVVVVNTWYFTIYICAYYDSVIFICCLIVFLIMLLYAYLCRLIKFNELQDSIEKLLIWFTEDLSVWWASRTHFLEAWTGDGVLFTRSYAFQTMFEHR